MWPTGWSWKHPQDFDRVCPQISPNICRFLALLPPLLRHGSCCPPGSLRFGPRTRSEEPCLVYYYLSSSSLMTPCMGVMIAHTPAPTKTMNAFRITQQDQGPMPHTIMHCDGSGGSLEAQQAECHAAMGLYNWNIRGLRCIIPYNIVL